MAAPRTQTQADVAANPLAVRSREAAKLLGISERLMWEWTRSEGVPHCRIGGVVLYPVEELRAWLAERSGLQGIAIHAPPERIAGANERPSGVCIEDTGANHGYPDAN
jgi:excisionase family DNA binding protein